MECSSAREWLFRRLDDELSSSELERLDAHLAQCPSCAREWRLLTWPQRLSRAIPALEPSPFFYSRLRARLQSEEQSVTLWQIILGLSRQIVPAMAAVTLVLLSFFAYLQVRDPRADVISAYDRIFTSSDRSQMLLNTDQSEITDESVLLAISEQERRPASENRR